MASEPFAAFPCDMAPDGSYDEVRDRRARGRALSLAVPADALIVKRVSGDQSALLAELGTLCSGASDVGKCQAALAELEKTGTPSATPCDAAGYRCEEHVFALTSAGDTIRLWSTPAQIRELLGPIESATEAWLLVQAEHREPPFLCGDPETNAQREIAGGYELRITRFTKGCRPLEQLELVYRVSREAAVERLSSKVIRSEPETCIEGSGPLVTEPQ